ALRDVVLVRCKPPRVSSPRRPGGHQDTECGVHTVAPGDRSPRLGSTHLAATRRQQFVPIDRLPMTSRLTGSCAAARMVALRGSRLGPCARSIPRLPTATRGAAALRPAPRRKRQFSGALAKLAANSAIIRFSSAWLPALSASRNASTCFLNSLCSAL